MLAYLDALITALCARDMAETKRLLDHPLVRILAPEARAEAELFLAGLAEGRAAPLRVMQSRHQTAQVLRDGSEAEELLEEYAAGLRSGASGLLGSQATTRLVQMEISLSA
ncbi:MAG TPA: hypothetical protein VM764_09415 [Gemmatimonadaceae bacterium]|jgi:hypothetical protein|nr:hypothetical protein [Gemmatimonadaceae bacterium]